jgi:hypothetical protein
MQGLMKSAGLKDKFKKWNRKRKLKAGKVHPTANEHRKLKANGDWKKHLKNRNLHKQVQRNRAAS